MNEIYEKFYKQNSLIKVVNYDGSYVIGHIISLEDESMVLKNDRTKLRAVVYNKDIKRVYEMESEKGENN